MLFRSKAGFFIAIFTAIYLSVKHSNDGNAIDLVIIWLTFSCLCYGFITADNVIAFKNGKKDKDDVPSAA